jgi:hypothetical protein
MGAGVASGSGELGEENLTRHPPSLRGKGVILPSPCGRGVGGEVDERVRCSEPNPPSPFPRREGGVTPLSLRERGMGRG